jgi:DNA repair protein RadD
MKNPSAVATAAGAQTVNQNSLVHSEPNPSQLQELGQGPPSADQRAPGPTANESKRLGEDDPLGVAPAVTGRGAVDWGRAEDLANAITAHVGTPGSTLRAYQAAAIIRVRNAYCDGARRIMLQLPTGAGKTRIASTVIRGCWDIERPVLFTVPAIELVDQTLKKLHAEGVCDVGVIQADHWMTNRDRLVQVASVQTLMRRELPPADLVFIDEAHKWFDFYRHWMLAPEWADVPFVGLSATPWTRGLGAYYEQLITPVTMQQLIDAGYLSRFRVFAPVHPDLKGVRTVGGDYHEGDLGAAMDKQPLVADIVETWFKHGAGRPTLCFAVNRAHAQHIADRFADHGVRAGYIDCYTPPAERAKLRRGFASGEYRVVCNVGVLTVGIDWDVRCIILARPTKSEMLYVQMIGRGLRPADGKDHCLILDHSDTTLRLGFVTEIVQEDLDNGSTRARAKLDSIRLPKLCPQCACLRPPSTPECPYCGFVATPVSNITHADGELHELRSDKTQIIDPVAEAARRRRFYGELIWIAREQGYKPGWPWHKFHEKFGDYPKGMLSEALPPTDQTRRWVKSRQIAFAKARWRRSA